MRGNFPSKKQIQTAPDTILAAFKELQVKFKGKRTRDISPSDKALIVTVCNQYSEEYSEASMELFIGIGRGKLYSFRGQPAVTASMRGVSIPKFSHEVLARMAIEKAAPKVITRDVIPHSARNMQDEWLKNNRPTQVSSRY